MRALFSLLVSFSKAASDSSAWSVIRSDGPCGSVTVASVIRSPGPWRARDSIRGQCSVTDVVMDSPQKPPMPYFILNSSTTFSPASIIAHFGSGRVYDPQFEWSVPWWTQFGNPFRTQLAIHPITQQDETHRKHQTHTHQDCCWMLSYCPHYRIPFL